MREREITLGQYLQLPSGVTAQVVALYPGGAVVQPVQIILDEKELAMCSRLDNHWHHDTKRALLTYDVTQDITDEEVERLIQRFEQGES